MLSRYALEIATKQERDFSYEHKFGVNPSLTSGSQSIWTQGGLYPWDVFDTAGTLTGVSTSTSDTLTATLYGLDENWNLQEEEVTFTGTSSFTTTKTWKRVYRLTCNSTNVGVLTFSKEGSVVLHVEAGKAQTLMAVYTVPAGYRCFGLQFTAGIGKNGDARFLMMVRDNYYNSDFRVRGEIELYQNTFTQTYAVPVPLTQKSDIDFRAMTTGNNFSATGSFDLILQKI
jgi:hypothetical protein